MKYYIDNFDLKSTILDLIEKYPNCTTYLYKMKDSIFFGSTPEMIFEYTNNVLKTEAIAGSIPNKGEKTEEIKRKFENTTLIEEHKIVSEYIEKQLLKISSNKIRKSDLEVKKLNNINHLQSKIEVEIKKLIKIRFGNPLGSILEGLGGLPAPLGRLLGALRRHLGASWASLGRSWAPLGWSWAPLGCILALRSAPDLDFGSFSGGLDWVWEAFGGRFWNAFCVQSLDLANGIYFGFSFSPCSTAVHATHMDLAPKSQK